MFVLDYIIENVAKDQVLKKRMKTKKDATDTKPEESSGVEVLTGDFHKVVEDFGEDVAPIYLRYYC